MGYLTNLIILFRRLMPLIKKIRPRMKRKNHLLRWRLAFIRKLPAILIPYVKIDCIFARYLITIRRISNKKQYEKTISTSDFITFIPTACTRQSKTPRNDGRSHGASTEQLR